MKIKDTPLIDRPREKMVKYGPDKLMDYELLAILLRTGTKEQNVCDLSKKILRKFEGGKLLTATTRELKQIRGLGEIKALEIIACFELGRRLLGDNKAALISSPKDIWESLRDIREQKKEHLVAFYIDSRNQEIGREIISIGTLTTSLIHPREIFEPAVRNLAVRIIIAHNHPSGIVEPSEDDIEVTKRLLRAGKIMGIEIVDHIIVSKNHYLSLKERGLM